MKVTGNSDSTKTESRSHVHNLKSPKESAASENSAKPSSVSVEPGAQPEISSKGREFAQAKEVASKAPDVREEKIARLKAMIASDQYKMDPHAIADRMVDDHLSSGIG